MQRGKTGGHGLGKWNTEEKGRLREVGLVEVVLEEHCQGELTVTPWDVLADGWILF